MQRTIFIGDLQGCFDEWMLLLKKLNYKSDEDQLILLGDVINRGPKSKEVLDYLLEHPEIKSVMGNHEYHFIRHIEKNKKKKSFQALESVLESRLPEYLAYLKSMPSYLESEEWIAVHAGLEPGKHPCLSSKKFLCTVREVGLNGESRPWYELYHGKKWVVFGHWALRGVVEYGKAKGLDSGCVYGGALTAWVYPNDELVSVSAINQHFDPFKN